MRKLNLKKESLTDLAAEDLAAVAGGTVTYGCTLSLNPLCVYDELRRLTIGSLDCTQVTTR